MTRQTQAAAGERIRARAAGSDGARCIDGARRAPVPLGADAPVAGGRSLLIVTTVAVTLRYFLLPYGRHLRSSGWHVEAAARGATASPGIVDAFDAVHDLPLTRSIRDVPALVRGERALGRLLMTSRPDIVHVHTPIAAFLTRLAVRRMPPGRRPLVVYTAHGFHCHPGGARAANVAFLTAERVAGRWTDRLIVINDDDERVARSSRMVPACRLVRMPGIGIDTDRYARAAVPAADLAAARREVGVDAVSPLFVFVGELNRNKRPGDAIRALALLPDPDPLLVLCGEGPCLPELQALAGRLGVGARVRFAGFVDDVRPFLAASAALVLPSEREGLSRAIMEALALEVPVIASTARGNEELVGSDAGVLVRTGDVAAMAAAMHDLVRRPDLARRLGERGRARVVERYALRGLLRRHDELYRELLTERADADRAGAPR